MPLSLVPEWVKPLRPLEGIARKVCAHYTSGQMREFRRTYRCIFRTINCARGRRVQNGSVDISQTVMNVDLVVQCRAVHAYMYESIEWRAYNSMLSF